MIMTTTMMTMMMMMMTIMVLIMMFYNPIMFFLNLSVSRRPGRMSLALGTDDDHDNYDDGGDNEEAHGFVSRPPCRMILALMMMILHPNHFQTTWQNESGTGHL